MKAYYQISMHPEHIPKTIIIKSFVIFETVCR